VAIIISRVANALIADVAVRAAPSRSVQGRTMNRYRRRYGGLWVGGRLTLSDTDIQSIESVEVLPGVLTKIIAVRAGGQLTKFRCFGARKVAEHIRAAARTAGGHDE
jgi:hypothetical protein